MTDSGRLPQDRAALLREIVKALRYDHYACDVEDACPGCRLLGRAAAELGIVGPINDIDEIVVVKSKAEPDQ